MISYLMSLFNNLFSKNSEEDDIIKDEFLAEQLLDLEISSEKNEKDDTPVIPQIPKNAVCFQRTGTITYIGENNYVLIDGMHYYELPDYSLNLRVYDKVLYLGYKSSDETIVVVRILEYQGLSWDEEVEENTYNVINHVLIGEVDYREDRFVYIKDNHLKFNLDNVEGTMIPTKGDWLEMKCTVQWDEDRPSDISTTQVLEVISFRPVRSKTKNAVVTFCNEEYGICDNQIYFNKHCLRKGGEPKPGCKVSVEAIESNQGSFTWRAIKLTIIENENGRLASASISTVNPNEDVTLSLQKEKKINITNSLKFDRVELHQTASIVLNITNNSNEMYIFNKWIVLAKKRDSQISIKPYVPWPEEIHPNQTFKLTITCTPKFLGTTRESLVLSFKGFQIKKFIEINIVDDSIPLIERQNLKYRTDSERLEMMKDMRKNNTKPFIPGVRLVKPPAFVPVKLGTFSIPDKVWNAVLGDSEQTVHTSDFKMIVNRIVTKYFPFLSQELNVHNYTDKWHTLLYMEEIQANINMRAYDMPKAFLIHCQEYLSLEIKGLSEKRPSLIKGDRVIVKDLWNDKAPQYEGYIHLVKNDMILMKFNQQFHETYSGSDVSVEFHFNRSTYRKSHQAINLAISNLGPDILFPSHVKPHSYQLPIGDLELINWFNEDLNDGQKAAVKNILLGECRPLPYCIYGPPGTGKTITVIETILQISTLLPHSRILVATPSNSAANLVTERLIEYRDMFPNSIVRLIANYLIDSENIPESIKPYCATLDIARENTAKSKHFVKDRINLNCTTSYIGRHRVTIGTCHCIGTLAQMGLPKGHFTHIIVDEAGQATEPEIMIPMTFTDKDNGQIILAGDPMQLGPVILSKYCKEFDMDTSYFSRILETFPYQRDYDAYDNGYDNRLVIQLTDNYRSLKEVLTLPSAMFYDTSLVPRIHRNQPWITKIVNATSEVFDMQNNKTGGIYVYGIRGENLRAPDSPSWYNPHEASMVALTTCKLYKKNITPDDIGIITPYIAQIKHLRLLFEAMGLEQPKIGTVEEFQGQERPLIIISTVRSSVSHVLEDIKHTLGFVKNPKRLNVALTRAQVAAILFCDPHLLSKDHLWNRVITQAVNEEKYMGCDLPFKYDDNNVFE